MTLSVQSMKLVIFISGCRHKVETQDQDDGYLKPRVTKAGRNIIIHLQKHISIINDINLIYISSAKLKPIFHQSANPFALGLHFGYDPKCEQCEHFILLIPKCI